MATFWHFAIPAIATEIKFGVELIHLMGLMAGQHAAQAEAVGRNPVLGTYLVILDLLKESILVRLLKRLKFGSLFEQWILRLFDGCQLFTYELLIASAATKNLLVHVAAIVSISAPIYPALFIFDLFLELLLQLVLMDHILHNNFHGDDVFSLGFSLRLWFLHFIFFIHICF